jgi:hypothetical protein
MVNGSAAKRKALHRDVVGAMTQFQEEHPEAEVRVVPEDKLRLDFVLQTSKFVDEKLPEMAEGLYDDFTDETTSVKNRLEIFKAFAQFALTDKRLAEGMGLVKDLVSAGGGSMAITTLLNISLEQARGVTPAQLTQQLLAVPVEEEKPD